MTEPLDSPPEQLPPAPESKLVTGQSKKKQKKQKKQKIVLDVVIVEAEKIVGTKESLFGQLFGKPSVCNSSCKVILSDKQYVTQTVENELNPVWNEDCTFQYKEQHGTLRVELRQSFAFGSMALIGEATVDLTAVRPGDDVTDRWCDLQSPASESDTASVCGRVHLLLHATSPGDETALLSHFGEPLSYLPIRVSAGDIVLFNTSYWTAAAARMMQGTDWDHIGMIIRLPSGKLRLFESIPDGVNRFKLNERLRFYHRIGKIGFRRLLAVRTKEMLDGLHDFHLEVLGRPYKALANVLEMIRAFSSSNQTENLETIFCSELLAAAFKRMGLLSPELCANNFLPRDFETDRVPLLMGKFGPLKVFDRQGERPIPSAAVGSQEEVSLPPGP
eukprot:TRINITY_DN10692_c0_g1_i1.p1 TRINITY_DN10692_c0_g1~~TRINITY_DN10692_c0_g1_i1.p1  ORF type:complete len:440 (+),score=94.96 TRINITY_DN10692_c0_g1_i1:154-1320(+)